MPDQAGERADLVKRLFPVAISVGFAAPLVQMQWLKYGHAPNAAEVAQLARLFTGLLITVLSWDWYGRDIARFRLIGIVRFILDIVIVFTYMLLLFTANNEDQWIVIIAVIFALFVLWDALVLIEGGERPRLAVYWRGFLNRAGVRRGPMINLSWLVYFVVVAGLSRYLAFAETAILCTFTLLGVLLLRADGEAAVASPGGTGGYSMQARGGVIVCLLLVYGVVIAWSRSCAGA